MIYDNFNLSSKNNIYKYQNFCIDKIEIDIKYIYDYQNYDLNEFKIYIQQLEKISLIDDYIVLECQLGSQISEETAK